MALRLMLLVLAVILVVAGPASAQEQAEPHSRVMVASSPLEIDLNSTQQVSLAVTLSLGFLVCQSDFIVPVSLSYIVEGLPRAPAITLPDSVDVAFGRTVLSVGYPYNYESEGEVAMTIGPLAGSAATGTLTVIAEYGGEVPSSCQTTGPIPAASNQTIVGLIIPEMVLESPEADAKAQSGAVTPEAGKDAPSIGPALLVLLLSLALRKRQA